MKKQGFSLVELLVSVMVISIIAVAFAPIVTKRIHGSFVGVKKEEQQNDQKKVEAGSVLYTVDTEGCTDKGRYVDCNFIPPEGVKKLNVVIVGSGMGGSGGVAGLPGTTDEVGGTLRPSEPLTIDYDPSTMSDFQILPIGGGGGGGGESLYDSGNCASGGGGAGGGFINHNIDITPTFEYDQVAYLKRIKMVPGKGGKRGLGNVSGDAEDGHDGENSYVYLKYCFPDSSYNHGLSGVDSNGCFESDYRALGGKGGTGAKYSVSAGVGGKPYFDGMQTKIYNSSADQYYVYGILYNSPAYGPVDDSYQYYGGDGSIAGVPSAGKGGMGAYSVGVGGNGGTCAMGGASKDGADGVIIYQYKIISRFGDGAGGAGGGSGGMIHVTDVEVVPGEIYNVWVGKGGKGGAANGEIGGSGSNSAFGSTAGSTNNIGGILTGYFFNAFTVKAAAQTSSSAAVQGYFKIYDDYNPGHNPTAMVPTYLDNEKGPTEGCSILDRYVPGYYKFVVSNYSDPTCSLTYFDTSYSSGRASAISAGAQGGDGMKSTTNNEYACGGKNLACGNSSVNGQSLTFRAPTVEGVKAGNYGSAGASGAGGGWDKETNTAGKGGDGQDGYVFIYWDEQ